MVAAGSDLLLVAGEASGDLHAARLLSELRGRTQGLDVWGLGSDEMAAAGCDLLADSREIAVVGIAEVLKILPRARQIFDQLLEEVDRRGTRVAVLVDFPDFNLRLAKQLHRRGVRVVYYISPQVWAWRKGRVKTIARTVDRMLVLFPFEVPFYEGHGIEVRHVGHPLVEEVPELPQAWQTSSKTSLQAPNPAEPATLALLPGSRKSEVRALLPTLLDTAALMARRRPLRVRLIQAPSLPESLVDELLAAGPGLEVERVRRGRFEAIAESHLALCASGTATLEVGLLTTPLVVVYRLNPFSYWLGRMLVDLPHVSMVNLVLDEGVVPEIIQGDFQPENLATVAGDLLSDRAAIDRMRSKLAELRPRLGARGASGRAAEAVAEVLAEVQTEVTAQGERC